MGGEPQFFKIIKKKFSPVCFDNIPENINMSFMKGDAKYNSFGVVFFSNIQHY